MGYHVFDYGTKGAADQANQSWEKFCDYCGTKYDPLLATELRTGVITDLQPPKPSPENLEKHRKQVAVMKIRMTALVTAMEDQAKELEKTAGTDTKVALELAQLRTDIQKQKDLLSGDFEYQPKGAEKDRLDAENKIYQRRKSKLEEGRGASFNRLKGQRTLALVEQMKTDEDYEKVMATSNPHELKKLMFKIIFSHHDNKYPYAIVVDNLINILGFQQNLLSDQDYHERSGTKFDVAKAQGVSIECDVLLNYEARLAHSMEFENCSPDQQQAIRTTVHSKFQAYVELRNASNKHSKVKEDLSDNYVREKDPAKRATIYPSSTDETFKMLKDYSKATKDRPTTVSEGGSFAQKGGGKSRSQRNRQGGGGGNFNKEFWKDKHCQACGALGHPHWSGLCADKKDDAKSMTSKRSTTSKSKKQLLMQVAKEAKQQRKAIANLTTTIEEINNASDLSDSEGESLSGSSHFQMKTTTVMEQAHHVSKSGELDLTKCILLDNQSTMNLFVNEEMLHNIGKSKDTMTVTSSGGQLRTNWQGSLHGFDPRVWLAKQGVANILALSHVKKQYRVTYDSRNGDGFIVHRSEFGLPDMHFREHPCGLHVFFPEPGELTFLNTVEDNKLGYTKKQLAGATAARELLQKLCFPSTKDFKWAIASNQIQNCPVTLKDIELAQLIWGKDIATLKGKTVQSKAPRIREITLRIPREFLKHNKEVTLEIDIFFVNKICFFMTLSRGIYYTSVNHLVSRKATKIFAAFKSLYKFYLHRGFRITQVNGDPEFDSLAELIADMPRAPRTNIASAEQHVETVERRIRTVKERARAVRHSLPYSRIPELMIIRMVICAVRALNHFVPKAGVSKDWSPNMLLKGVPFDYKLDLKTAFGSYCQVHRHDTPRNSDKSRTLGAICLGPTGNTQGGYYFMNLTTGKRFSGFKWDELPIPEHVIKRVNHLGKAQPKRLIWFDRHGKPIDDPPDDQLTGVADDEDHPDATMDELDLDIQEEQREFADYEANEPAPAPEPLILPPTDDDIDVVELPQAVEETAEPPAAPPAVGPPQVPVLPAPPVPAPEPQSTGVRRSTRVKFAAKAPYVPSMSGKRYATAMAQLAEDNHGALHPDLHAGFMQHMIDKAPKVVARVMTQMSMKAGLKAWGNKANKAVYDEMYQLHMRDTFRPKHWKQLTKEQRAQILESHLFLKMKRCGTVKARTVAGGNKQRAFINKEDASSPTVSTNSVLLSCIIDATEGRDVATIDIPNAFIQTRVNDPNKRVLIKVKGLLAEILLEIAPEVYSDYVHIDPKGNLVLILECLNAIYGTMIASLLYFGKFCRTLENNKFIANDYDPCVYNKMVEGKQQTVLFHVDDCKLSHVNTKVNDKLIEILRKEYENIFEDGSGKMKVHRGKVHEYLGMTLDFSEKGLVKVSMPKYIEECLTNFDKIMPNCKGTKSSAAPRDLFEIDDEAEKLPKLKREQFHSLVAKVLFAAKRARPDTGLAISFLMTRAQSPDTDDWRKLAHMMRYLRGTKDLPLTLGASGKRVLNWMIDASHAVHPKMRGHTGGGLTLGRGFPMSHSGKQKLNTRSSTETELVGVDDMMPDVLWSALFLQEQGFEIKNNLIHQDNQAAILLEKNGKSSSGKRTKHINTRYFFVTDRIEKGDVSVTWCPTEDMTGDFWTKPLQGALFKRFRDLIMGVVPHPKPRGIKKKTKSAKHSPTKS